MSATSEHPRIAITLAAGLIVLALAAVGAGRALGGAQPVRTSDRALRVADSQVTGLQQQLKAAEAQSGQLRGQVTTLTAELARAQQSHRRPETTAHVKRRRAKH